MGYLIVFIFGAIIGSFLNVCIHRVPKRKSIVSPPSHCPECNNPISWFDNVPLLSYLILRAKCRHCGIKIRPRYFIVELITALTSVSLLYYLGLSISFFIYWLFSCALIAIIFIDIEHQIVPDVISIPGMFAGIVLIAANLLISGATLGEVILTPLLGVIAGGGSMYLMGFFGELVFKKEALGGGDVKLMAMIGAFLGWKLALLTFFMAPLLGSMAGIFIKIRFKKDIMPYAPYISIAAFISLLYGNAILKSIFYSY